MNALLLSLLTLASGAAPGAASDGGEGPRDPALRLHSFEVPRALEQVEVEGGAVSLGVPMELSAVRTRASTEELYVHFLAEFKRRGLYVPPPEHLTPVLSHPSLTALDPLAEVAYTFIFQPARDGTVTVIVARADLKRRGKSDEPLPIPLLPGARGLVRTRVEGTEVFAFDAPATAAEVDSFYDAVLPSGGWRRRGEGVFTLGTSEARISSTQGAGGRRAVTVVVGPRRGGDDGAER